MRLTMASLMFAVLAAAAALVAGPAFAQSGPVRAPTTQVEVGTLPPISDPAPATLDVAKAVDGYLATISGEKRARSDAYFEGGYYLLVVDLLYALAVSAILLWSRFSAAMGDLAKRVTRSKFWQVPIYAVLYVIATAVLTFPLVVYEQFFREHAYGMSNQTFMQWFSEFGIGLGLEIVIAALALAGIYSVIRRFRETWWIWGSVLTMVFFVIGDIIAPVVVAPLFNTYVSLPASPLREEILSIARANQIPADDVFLFDASKQTKRISANVSGFMGTTRISLNDNLLKRTSEREVLAVMGHEMGHYALDHSIRLFLFLLPLVVIGFALANWGFRLLTGVFGGNWDVRSVDDPAGLPVLAAIASLYMFLLTPVTNSIVRNTEAQADLFGLNAARQPDGFAQATLRLSEYRKLDPSPWEEVFFYDHPSGRSRITMSMQWKSEHMGDADIRKGPVSPQ